MEGIEVSAFGGPDVLTAREVPDPVPGPGQILVAASACDVLFVDTMIRSGRGADYFPIRPPYVPGNGVGGKVVATGEGVESSWIGRSVVAHTGATGGYAASAVADVVDCAEVPSGVELLDATAVLHDGTTALRVLERTEPKAGEWVLVLGAAGGMGILLVQILTSHGVRVVGAAGGRTKQRIVSEAGAVAAVDYSAPAWTEAVLDATGGRRPAVILDGVGGDLGTAAFDLIEEGGRFSAHGTPSGSFAALGADEVESRGITVTSIADLQYGGGDRTRLIAAALDEVEAGRAAPLIGQMFALGDASKAHMAIESRETIAKTILVPGEG